MGLGVGLEACEGRRDGSRVVGAAPKGFGR